MTSVQAERATHGWRFVVIGAGGLGCPALLGLVAAGARNLCIVDDDCVEVSNLQRQVLYAVGDLGMPKVEAARQQLARRSPDVTVEVSRTRLEPTEVEAFVTTLPARTVVLECTDSPAIKFAFNDAALAHDVPLVIGAALGLHGQSIAVQRGGACYRCIYETPPNALPTCETAGVLGAAVGATGFHMASLALALAEGRRDVAGRLWAVDLRRMAVQSLQPAPRAACPACGPTHVTTESRHQDAPTISRAAHDNMS